MPIRNLFKRGGADADTQDENRPFPRDGADRGFQKTPVVGTKPIEIQEPAEYKLCEINDSGIYLPPSPPEKKGLWHSSSRSTTSSNHRSFLSDNEPFNISRESFDSYRRSFDISARSPVPDNEGWARQSSDSRRMPFSRASFDRRSDRPSLDRPSLEKPSATQEEGFEDVGLDEPKPQPKRRGLFSRFGDSDAASTNSNEPRPTSSHHGFHFSGRKRGQSGQGSELRSMPNAMTPEITIEAR